MECLSLSLCICLYVSFSLCGCVAGISIEVAILLSAGVASAMSFLDMKTISK